MKGGGVDSDSGRRRLADEYSITSFRSRGVVPRVAVSLLDEFSTLYEAADYAASNDVDVLDDSSEDRLLAVDGVGPKVRDYLASLSLLPGGSQPTDVNRELWTVDAAADGGHYVLSHRDETQIIVVDAGECWRVHVERSDSEFNAILCEGSQSFAIEAARMAARRYPLLTNPRTLEPDTPGWVPRDPANHQRHFYHE